MGTVRSSNRPVTHGAGSFHAVGIAIRDPDRRQRARNRCHASRALGARRGREQRAGAPRRPPPAGRGQSKDRGRCHPRCKNCSPPVPMTPSRSPRRAARLTYRALRALVADTLESLERARRRPQRPRRHRARQRPGDGERRSSRCASARDRAPLNPAYRADEFEFYLTDLHAKALIVAAGQHSPAIEVAAKLGVPHRAIWWPTTGARRGHVHARRARRRRRRRAAAHGGYGEPDDIALVLHTSGTTSRPKIVPLAQQNICASARQHRATRWRSRRADRGLNIMPLFHIHGLIAALLAPLSAGGAVFCTPGFNALKFFAWIDEVQPTWYTAVPTMHQAILRARRAQRRRSSRATGCASSARRRRRCRRTVIAELEQVFGAPVIEAYGMTEAAHQMATQPAAAGARKPGSVGHARPAPRSRSWTTTARCSPPARSGEIVIRGPNVTAGYENNPKANAEAFTQRLVPHRRPGRAGRRRLPAPSPAASRRSSTAAARRSPRARSTRSSWTIPAVASVRHASRMPHDKLGEEVAAAVVLREGASATERELREFAASAARRLQGAAARS